MNTRHLFAVLLVLGLVGCGDDDDGGTDAMPDVTTPLEIFCPDRVTLGCDDLTGDDAAVFGVEARGGADLVISCDPSVAALSGGDIDVACTATSGARTASCSLVAVVPDVEASLRCAPSVQTECTGETTRVSVPEPATFGCADGAVESDGPDAFALGETVVTFRSGSSSCETTVAIADSVPPTVSCEAERVFVRASPDAVYVPAATARDLCADVTLTSDEVPAERGVHAIVHRAEDTAGNEASCETMVEVLDAFAPDARLISAQREGGATVVTLAWSADGEDTDEFVIERADSAAGPFSPVLALPGDVRTFTDEPLLANENFYRVVAYARGERGGESQIITAYAVDATGYDLRDVRVPGIGFATTLYGVVRHPRTMSADTPLLLFLHGNHGNCRQPGTTNDGCGTSVDHECPDGRLETTPNAEGYIYLQETLAAQGYVTVSISGNAMNCRADFIAERTQLILEHLRRWVSWSERAGGPFGSRFVDRVDVSRVGLMGHSRGGDAVSSVPEALERTPIAGLNVESIFALAPTDFHDADPSGSAYAVLLPGCDGDVSNLIGVDIYDRGLGTEDDEIRSQVLIVAANHNFYNTEWTADDGQRVCTTGRLGGSAQRGSFEGILSEWFAGTVPVSPSDDVELAAFERADAATPEWLTTWAGQDDLELRWSYQSESGTYVDDLEAPGAPNRNLLGESNTYTDLIANRLCSGSGCGRSLIHGLKSGVVLAWQDETGVARFELGEVDASEATAVSLRASTRNATLNTGREVLDFVVRVEDASGDSAQTRISQLGRLGHLFAPTFNREALQTFRFPLQPLAERVDLSRLVAIELEFLLPGFDEGSVFVTDLEIAD